jgi:indolepyruvate ferredoxin oxidoreductase
VSRYPRLEELLVGEEFGQALAPLSLRGLGVVGGGLGGRAQELAATSLAGSQLLDSVGGARHEGVLGLWYGKAPGADRAADALKHGNYVGAHPSGGVVVAAGDDPECKSSSLPSTTRGTFHDALMPVLCPGSPQEVADLGQHAVELSRASGLWAGLAVVAEVADGFGTIAVREPSGLHVPVDLPDGATRWLEGFRPQPGEYGTALRRIMAGPPH